MLSFSAVRKPSRIGYLISMCWQIRSFTQKSVRSIGAFSGSIKSFRSISSITNRGAASCWFAGHSLGGRRASTFSALAIRGRRRSRQAGRIRRATSGISGRLPPSSPRSRKAAATGTATLRECRVSFRTPIRAAMSFGTLVGKAALAGRWSNQETSRPSQRRGRGSSLRRIAITELVISRTSVSCDYRDDFKA